MNFENMFLWRTTDGIQIEKYPYYASINTKNEKTFDGMDIKIPFLEWLICPEDVYSEHKNGNKIYKLVEATEEEIAHSYQYVKELKERGEL